MLYKINADVYHINKKNYNINENVLNICITLHYLRRFFEFATLHTPYLLAFFIHIVTPTT